MTALTAHDRIALLDLVHRYAALVDDRDLAGAAALFSADGVLVVPDPPAALHPVTSHAGPTAIAAALAVVNSLPVTVHAIVGAVFDPGAGAGTAIGRVSCTAHHVSRRKDRETDLVWHIVYRDHYRTGADGWRLTSRRLSIEFIESRPVAVARSAAGAASPSSHPQRLSPPPNP